MTRQAYRPTRARRAWRWLAQPAGLLELALVALVVALAVIISLEAAASASTSAPPAGASRSSAARAAVETKAPDPSPLSAPAGPVLAGTATWYGADGLVAAAGPRLREWLGRGWRGSRVDVCRDRGSCVRVTLSDWCQCPHHVVDLSDDAFSQLARLSRGVIPVRVALGAPPRETITQPPTDTAP